MGILPIKKSEKNTNLSDQVILVYGRPKIGKSTLCSYFDDAVFLATEPGLNHLEVNKVNITSWKKFLEACAELAGGKHNFKTVIVDTVDNLITYCSDYVCTENNIDHPSELPHGKGWSMVTTELKRAVIKLAALPYGLIMVSHAKQEEIETKTKKYNRFSPDLSGKNKSVVLNMQDIILFMDSGMKDGEEVGIVRTKPSLFWDAGDKSKLLAPEIMFPLANPKVAYDKIKQAFSKPTTKETK